MNSVDMAILNLKETRRRSIKLWRSLPDEWLSWRPDKDALSFGEMIRHVWSGSYEYHMIIQRNGDGSGIESQPYDDEPVQSVEREIALSEPYFERFIAYVRERSDGELSTRMIERKETGMVRGLGDMLLRVAYHDAVHAGQFLQYMRMVGLERPQIWD